MRNFDVNSSEMVTIGYNCENSVFSGDLCTKVEKSLGSGPFPRDGRVTGNKHLFFRPK